MHRGLAPALGGEELARYVPEIADVCDFDVVQPMNIDSTNMRPADWMRIRDEIVDAYDAYDGFVVLHGTDTMAYTAAALSYLVQGSPKPIVLLWLMFISEANERRCGERASHRRGRP